MKIAYVVGKDNPTDPDPDLDIPFATEGCSSTRYRFGLYQLER
jgi:hypothetical protein